MKPLSRLDRCCLAALVAMYALPVLAMVAWAATRHTPLTVVAILLAAVLLASVIGAVTRVWAWFFLLQLPLVVLSLGFAAYTLRFGMPPGETLAQIVAGASREELRGFVAMTPGYWLACSLAAWTAAYAGLCLKLPRRPIFGPRSRTPVRVLLGAAAVAAAYCSTDPAQMAHGLSLDPAIGSVLFLAADIPRAGAELRGVNVRKVHYGAHGSSAEEVHVLVIGESVRRESWSAYGYSRRTTPGLDAIRDELVLLRGAVADSNLTDWSVPIILTGIPPERFALSSVRGTLLDLAREGGYATAWLANQDLNISKSIGIDADLFYLPPDPGANIFGRGTLDEALLPTYRRELNRSGKPRFIAIHTMGAHWEYFRRYPAAFRQFGTRESLDTLSSGSLFLRGPASQSALVDAYDNATLYTDWFLTQLIDAARGLSVPASLLFFPDHGEDLQLLDGVTGHGLPQYSRHAFEIPAFVWVNDAFRRAHPQVVAALQANAGREIRSHDVFATEAQLMGITWPGADPQRSFAAGTFLPDSGMRVVAGGVLVSRP